MTVNGKYVIESIFDLKTDTSYAPCKDSENNLYIPYIIRTPRGVDDIAYMKVPPMDVLPVIDPKDDEEESAAEN